MSEPAGRHGVTGASTTYGIMSKKRNIKVGQVYLVKTPASVNVLKKITKIDDIEKGWYSGCLVTERDRDALINQQVAYRKGEDPSECISWISESDIIKRVYNKRNSGTINNKRRKSKRRVYDPNSRKNSK